MTVGWTLSLEMELGGEINMTVIVKGEKAGERSESKYPSFWLEVHG